MVFDYSKGYLGNFQATDYGIIMFSATIIQMSTSSVKNAKYRKYQSICSNVQTTQPVLNKEIMFNGNSQRIMTFSDIKTPLTIYDTQNRICGKIADFNNLSFSPYTQARHFDSLPTLSQSFAVADDVRKDYLFAPTEDAYSVQFSIDCRAVRPIPYKPVPSNFGL